MANMRHALLILELEAQSPSLRTPGTSPSGPPAPAPHIRPSGGPARVPGIRSKKAKNKAKKDEASSEAS